MLEIQDEIKSQARPGTVTGELYQLMITLAEKKGYCRKFYGSRGQKDSLYRPWRRSGIGRISLYRQGPASALQEGMVIALEPKTIFPGRGVVGIENTHLVTKNGLESPSCFPDEITVLP